MSLFFVIAEIIVRRLHGYVVIFVTAEVIVHRFREYVMAEVIVHM